VPVAQRYRIKTPTVAVFVMDGSRLTVTVPIDAVVWCDDLPAHNQLIEVVWNNTTYAMFTKDLRERCEPVE